MNRIYLTLFLLLCALSCEKAQDTCDIEICPREPIAAVSPLFWGTNFLYWVEDDDALRDGSIEKALSELPAKLLRFPGGTVADNYHWKTNLLDNPAMFPYEQGDTESDFDEFIGLCRRIGAEPIVVVNTQSWAVRKDIQGGADEAAGWVEYCRQKGYNVKYWEIGNETYWHPVMTAREYGKLVSVYSKAMKAVDPDIIVSANGPWDINASGDKERLDSALWEQTRLKYLDLKTKEQYLEFKDQVKEATVKPWTEGKDKWWHGVISECGDDIDMVSVHWYYFDNNVKHIDNKTNELMAYLKEMKPDKDYLLCYSEYNCNTKEGEERILGFVESIGRLLCSGVDLSCFWPFRIGGSQFRSMLDISDNGARYPYQVFNMFQKDLKGDMVRCKSADGIYTFSSYDGKDMTIVISNRGMTEDRDVRIETHLGLRNRSLTGTLWTPDRKFRNLEPQIAEVSVDGSCLSLTLKPHTFATITIR